ncbi:hypothetical protein KY290_034324 [Solanum tuberosum]|uniref:Uncharacterized protein n=1 Tax=Solanum tuberosum TaxID=4113 RepID=A0ABQ7U300_SOLTU|nr:hypothetical protein KY290_034324 [Solanum tuberosum]
MKKHREMGEGRGFGCDGRVWVGVCELLLVTGGFLGGRRLKKWGLRAGGSCSVTGGVGSEKNGKMG